MQSPPLLFFLSFLVFLFMKVLLRVFLQLVLPCDILDAFFGWHHHSAM